MDAARIDALCLAALLGDLQAAERQRLEDLLRSDARARQRFAAWCRQDMVLGTLLREDRDGANDAGPAPRRRRPERPLRRRRRGPRARPVLGALAAAASLLVVATWWFLSTSPAGSTDTDAATTGPVLLVAGSAVLADGTSVQPGALLPAGAVLVTAAGEQALLRWQSAQIRLRLAAESRFELGRRGTQLGRLQSGAVVVRVSPQHRSAPIRIAAPWADCTVLGTVFTLLHTDERSGLTVQEGRVHISARADGAQRHLGPGERAWTDATGLLAGDGLADARPPLITACRLIDGRGVLIDADFTGGRIRQLPADGISLIAEAVPGVAAVRFTASGPGRLTPPGGRLEQYAPFTLAGDLTHQGGPFDALQPAPGRYLIRIQPYADRAGEQPLGEPVELAVTVGAAEEE